MTPEIVKRKSTITLIDKDTGFELFEISKHDLNNSYRIIDYRLTDEHTEPTKDLSDLSGFCSVRFEVYEENKEKFNFPIKIIEKNNYKFVRWRDMNGVLLDGDRKDNVFDFKTESFQWSYKESLKRIKSAKEYWKNHKGSIENGKFKVSERRITESNFW